MRAINAERRSAAIRAEMADRKAEKDDCLNALTRLANIRDNATPNASQSISYVQDMAKFLRKVIRGTLGG